MCGSTATIRGVFAIAVALTTCDCDRDDRIAPRASASSSVVAKSISPPSSAAATSPHGTLSLDFPGQLKGEPVSVRWSGGETWLRELPSSLAVPLEQDVTVWASSHGGKHFEKKLRLTAAAPSSSVTITFEQRPPLGLFGFKRSELPEATGFTPTPARKLTAAPLIFQLGAAQRGQAGVELGIDEAGTVVVFEKRGAAVTPVALGNIDPQVLTAMVNAAKEAADDQKVFLGVGCSDCGYASISFSRMSGGKRVLHELATDGEGRRRVQSREGQEVVRWLLAVRERTGRRFWGDRR
jgi:hypothetical protein